MNIIVNEVGFYIRYSIYYIAWPIRFYAAAFLSAFEASVTTDSIWYSSERAATNDLKFLNLVRSLGWCWPACFDNTSRRLNALEFWQQSGNGWVCINSFASADISAWDSIWRINILLNTSTWRLVGKSWIFPSTDCFGGDRGCVDDEVVTNNNFNREDRSYFFSSKWPMTGEWILLSRVWWCCCCCWPNDILENIYSPFRYFLPRLALCSSRWTSSELAWYYSCSITGDAADSPSISPSQLNRCEFEAGVTCWLTDWLNSLLSRLSRGIDNRY